MDERLGEAWDDVSAKNLDPREVMKARGEEVKYIRKRRSGLRCRGRGP